MLQGKTLLITGGTGSFGRQLVRTLQSWGARGPSKIIIYSRDELKQSEMRASFADDDRLRFFIGDVRDGKRMRRAFDGVDIVVHAAALKQVPSAEYNPFEVIKTNVHGAQNVVDAAIDCGVDRVIALSTDKACAPLNLYGATKLCSDKLFTSAAAYVGSGRTRFAVVRYGNVIGSRGSVFPFFMRQAQEGRVTITDERMTRFLLTLQTAALFVVRCLHEMHGSEIFVPKIPSANIIDIAEACAPGVERVEVGIRPGEKLHEVMIVRDDAPNTYDCRAHYVIVPAHDDELRRVYEATRAELVPPEFAYASNTNDRWYGLQQLQGFVSALREEGVDEHA